MNSPLLDKSLDFATQIVLFYEEFSKAKKKPFEMCTLFSKGVTLRFLF